VKKEFTEMTEQKDHKSDISKSLENIASLIVSGRSAALIAPKLLQQELAERLAGLILCLEGNACQKCPSCRLWVGKTHPDLIPKGSFDQAPGIDDCRRIWEDISLVPVAGPCRLAVLYGCDRLSLPAGNSLLKITEEPPEKGRILLFLEEDNLIPTLRSRLVIFKYPVKSIGGPSKFPEDIEEFMKWIESAEGKKPSELLLDLSEWIPALVKKRKHQLAARIETVRMISEKGNLKVAMIQDLVHEALQEGSQFDHLFGDLW
jgi:DNA polymerase-3 subunit delta'